MGEMDVLEGFSFREQEVELPAGHNEFVIGVAGQTFVALAQGAVELVRSEEASEPLHLFARPGRYVLRTDGEVRSVETRAVEVPAGLDQALAGLHSAFQLEIKTDARDQHTVDGVPEIKADGKSSCTITVRKLDRGGTPLAGKSDNDEVFLRTTGGLLLKPGSPDRVRSLKLSKGEAKFRLLSEDQPRFVTVTALAAGPTRVTASVSVEFV